MTLLQAQDALRRDPNRALAWLLTLSPEFTDAATVRRIAADAHARGISRAFPGHTGYINRFGVSADGARFVTASDDKTARISDLATGASLVLTGHTDEVWAAQFTRDDAEVATPRRTARCACGTPAPARRGRPPAARRDPPAGGPLRRRAARRAHDAPASRGSSAPARLRSSC
jgi:hypothetical protein